MPENPTRPHASTESTPAPEAGADPAHSPTLADEFLQSACTLARGRMSWTPGPGHDTEVLPWLKGATAA
jgi:hypothetical protein